MEWTIYINNTAATAAIEQCLPDPPGATVLTSHIMGYSAFLRTLFVASYDEPKPTLDDLARDAALLERLADDRTRDNDQPVGRHTLQWLELYATLIGDLARNGVTPDDLPDGFAGVDLSASDLDLCRFLKKNWAAHNAEFIDHSRCDHWLAAHPERIRFPANRKPDRIVFKLGVPEFSSGRRRLAAALKSIGVNIFVDETPPAESRATSALGILQRAGESDAADSKCPPAPAESEPTLRILYSPSIEREAIEQLARVRRWAEAGDVSASDIAVVVPDIDSYRAPLSVAAKRLGVPLAFRRGRALLLQPCVRAALAVLQLASADEPLDMSLLCDCLTSAHLTLAIADADGFSGADAVRFLQGVNAPTLDAIDRPELFGQPLLDWLNAVLLDADAVRHEFRTIAGGGVQWAEDFIIKEFVSNRMVGRVAINPDMRAQTVHRLNRLFLPLRRVLQSETVGEAALAFRQLLAGDGDREGLWPSGHPTETNESRWARETFLERLGALEKDDLRCPSGHAADYLIETIDYAFSRVAYMGDSFYGVRVVSAREAVGMRLKYMAILGADDKFLARAPIRLPYHIQRAVSQRLRLRGESPLPDSLALRQQSDAEFRAIIGGVSRALSVSFPFHPSSADRGESIENPALVSLVQRAFEPTVETKNSEDMFRAIYSDTQPFKAFIHPNAYVEMTRQSSSDDNPNPVERLAGAASAVSSDDDQQFILERANIIRARRLWSAQSGNDALDALDAIQRLESDATEPAQCILKQKRRFGVLSQPVADRVLARMGAERYRGNCPAGTPALRPSQWRAWLESPSACLWSELGYDPANAPDGYLSPLLSGSFVHKLIENIVTSRRIPKPSAMDSFIQDLHRDARPLISAFMRVAEKTRAVGSEFVSAIETSRMLNRIEIAALFEWLLRGSSSAANLDAAVAKCLDGASGNPILSEKQVKAVLATSPDNGQSNGVKRRVYIQGQIDRFVANAGRIFILDYKSGKKPKSPSPHGLWNAQALLYALALAESEGIADADPLCRAAYLYLGGYEGVQSRHRENDAINADALFDDVQSHVVPYVKMNKKDNPDDVWAQSATEVRDALAVYAAAVERGMWLDA
ncbi:MAG: PD-(D/E)XK nuclease family protein [Planctomycetota bacterium]